MSLPSELQPTETTDIVLADGTIATLPVCRPKFSPWNGIPVSFDYGKKPILNYKDDACFAELVILRILLENGWEGVWVESYGGTHYLRTMPNEWALKSEHVSIPEDKEAILRKIWNTAKTSACFDVFAWKGKDVLLCEAKRTGKDKLTEPQKKFIAGALACDISPESLLIVEWSFL
ncbi:MAG: hypothetical protein COT91_03490 [Candidatus Doudnabacteria bacterium CG10_big_fil_rev_8_21_14_0_10_41_10]|uniref:VRR-NUC domain-containing protein n=1 Tax=Candidatus Doudnabacteria bacterium CG10_big_fil_rev_8_21_14_0_10_41_10 TaxID=1974551 RepID=A0A2H0VD90_9BACT|nr:MAG: hypothetical protein COT91_03490 [Candidatus Doudnabacteria bacterium CG10_big_fil_rev_8_21_14_0_10_41_10]